MKDQRNLILAVVLSALVLIGYSFIQPRRIANPPPPAPTSPAAPAIAESPVAQVERSDVLSDAPRIPIDTPRLRGSLSLAGARIDDLVLKDYFETVEHQAQVTLLSPAGTADPFYVEFGWTADNDVPVPDNHTVWTAAGDQKLTPGSPVKLTWDNGAGLIFTRVVSVDQDYLFTVQQTVVNNSTASVALRSYGEIVRPNPPSEKQAAGAAPTIAGFYGSGLDEESYKDLTKAGTVTHDVTGGWVGMNDKYWLVNVAPPTDLPATMILHDLKSGGSNRYSAEYQGATQNLAAGASLTSESHVFAGAKEQKLLADYEDAVPMPKLERAIDFGWLFFLAKPFFIAIHFIALYVGNFGVAILIFNVILKIILFPLQDRSYHQMARMRDLQPKIAALKERFGDDKEKMAAAQMELFKKEKINPAAGCLPLFAQLPIFYALFRVLSTTIEMRQAPFFGWIHDLSAPDPTTIFNLFGLIPWTPPSFLPALGVWPLIYGGTMYLQQRMMPTTMPSADPMQQRIMAFMPLIFMFFFLNFPAGLTIYYSWNAVLTIGQMALIRRRSEQRQATAANKA